MLKLALVGRPNVGKSTLFNRMAGKRLAIVNDTPGVTRDWREADGFIMGEPIRIIDTAGLEESFDDSIQGRMRRQTEAALKEADVILFLVDGRAGITPMDEHFATVLRKQNLPVILAINKCESEKVILSAQAEAYKLGLGDPILLSAEHGEGLDVLYHMLRPYLEDSAADDEVEEEDNFSEADLDALEGKEDYDFAAGIVEDETKPIKVAIVGRPNVGKSTMMNTLLGEERVMTGPEAGITRDAVAVHWSYNDRLFRLVDTAGMRKQARIYDAIEKMSVDDTLRAIRLAQVVILVLDGNNKMEKQDLLIADHVLSEGRALVIAVNKWDEVQDRTKAQQDIQDRLMASLAQVPNVPVVMLSALKNRNLDRMMDEVLRIYDIWSARAPTAGLNKWLSYMESKHPAPMVNGKPNRLKYIAQIKSRPPTFALWMSRPGDLADSYKRYLINGIREDYNMHGIPIRILVRASKNPYDK